MKKKILFPRSKKFLKIQNEGLRVNILQKMETQGDQHLWKRRKRINLLNLSYRQREHYSMEAVRMGWNSQSTNTSLLLPTLPDKHTCRCLLHVHTAPALTVPTFTCNIHSTVIHSLTQVTISKRAQDLGLTMEIISDTSGTSIPRWWEGLQWTN